jgi:hypothetical protein
MKASPLVAGITLIAVLALIGTACWQAAGRHDPAVKQPVERDVFGAPVTSGTSSSKAAAQVPKAATSDPGSADGAAGAPQPEKADSASADPEVGSLPQQFDPQPAEPFEMPEIMAYA